MLSRLEIHNIVLIDQLTIDLSGGLTVLTGETGAGKSILLDALGLVRGDRADTGLIRRGAAQAFVTAVFDLEPDHPVFDYLHEQGFRVETPVILRRVLSDDGKSRAFINDQTVSVGVMKTVGAMLIDLHGQFETGHLFDPAYHRDLVDRFGDLGGGVESVRAAWHVLSSARTALQEVEQNIEQTRRDQEYLRISIEDLEKLAPEKGEETRLLDRRSFLSARVQIIQGLSDVLAELQGDSGVESGLARAGRILDRVRQKLPQACDQWMASVDSALSAVRDASAGIESFLFESSDGLDSLDQIEDRLHDIRAGARRYGCAPDDLVDKKAEMESQLDLIRNQTDILEDLYTRVRQAEVTYMRLAGDLSFARTAAGRRLDHAMSCELSPLKLEKARFQTEMTTLSPDRYGPTGIDAIRFMVCMNAGGDLAPIDKVASGGELSRLMLALKVIARDKNQVCRVFDEVDSGLGGAVADAMAQRLSRLSQGGQVLVVTHVPQVAARADHHLIVSKKEKGGKTMTSVIILETNDLRCEEIARMLSGEKITNEARAAAQKLIEARAA